ncbi:MAG: DNA repair protein RecO, partial [Clostridia bacterium]|nr:DNA repair protein RecO [Clostridia bacterium]
MTEIKVNGLVLFDREIGENDKLLTVLTERYGKLFVIAKGAKSIKNRNMCCTHIFSYASFGIRRKGNYYYLVDSDLIENFFNIRNDILKLTLASYVCDVVNHV